MPKTEMASAAKKSASAAREKQTATHMPSTTPSRTGRERLYSNSTRVIMSGMTHCAVQFRCELAWEIIAGANPQKSPPTLAPSALALR